MSQYEFEPQVWSAERIESFQTEAIKNVLACLDTMCGGLESPSAVKLRSKTCSDGDNSSWRFQTENRRQEIDRIDRLSDTIDLQLLVLEEATRLKRAKLENMKKEKERCLGEINELASKHMSLPEEIMLKIFRVLYYLEGKDDWIDQNNFEDPDFRSFLRRHPPRTRTSLSSLIDDEKTPMRWKNILEREIPVVMGNANLANFVRWQNVRFVQSCVGFGPRFICLDGASDSDALASVTPKASSFSTTILLIPSERNRIFSILNGLSQVKWHSLVFAQDDKGMVDYSFGSGMDRSIYEAKLWDVDMINTIITSYYRKVMEVDRLVIPSSLITNRLRNIRSPFDTVNLNDVRMVSRIRSALLPLSLLRLPRFLPILNQVSTLQVPITIADLEKQLDCDGILAFLQPYSNTLESLSLYVEKDFFATLPQVHIGDVGSAAHSFPVLRCLSLEDSLEYLAWGVFTSVDCPLLRELSMEFQIKLSRKYERDERHISVTAGLLHEKFPQLESVRVSLKNHEFLIELAKPGANGKWLLPNLRTLLFDGILREDSHSMEYMLEIVRGRRNSKVTKSINSIHLKYDPDMEQKFEMRNHINLLRTLVPVTHISSY